MGSAEGERDDLASVFVEHDDGDDAGWLARRRRFDEALMAGPECYAVVLAAADWREAADIAVSDVRLYRQAVRRMRALAPGRVMTEEEFARGLAWATEDPALLRLEAGGTYELAEMIAPPASLDQRPGVAVSEALARLTPLEAVAVGKAAWYSQPQNAELARSAWQFAADSDDDDAAALAQWYRADAARDDGDITTARAAFEQIIRENHFATAPRAMLALAELNVDAAPDAAEWLFRQAIRSGLRPVVIAAARQLRWLCLQRGDEAEAIVAGRIAFEHTDPLLGAHDGIVLAGLLIRSGDTAGAEQILRHVIALDDPLCAGQAAGDLARLLVARGDLTGAERLLTRAMAHETVFRADLIIALAGIRLVQEDVPAARRLLAEARAGLLPPSPVEQARADVLEAQIAITVRDDETAERIFRRVLDHDDDAAREAVREWALQLGERLRVSGPCEIPGAAPLLRHLMIEAATPLREWAAYGVGRIAEAAGDLRQARQAYRLAARGGNTRYAVRAAHRLADAPSVAEKDQALDALLRVIESEPGYDQLNNESGEEADAAIAEAISVAGTLVWRREDLDLFARVHLIARITEAGLRHTERVSADAARIAFTLGGLYADVLDSPGGAIPALEIAAESDNPEIAAPAAYHLGLAHIRTAAPISAVRALQRAIASRHPAYAPQAMITLGLLAEDLTDVDTVIDAHLQALGSEHPLAQAHATFQLACLIGEDQPDDAEYALHAIIASNTAPAPIVGAAYAQLGRIYARNGNRRFAQRYWRQGKRHTDPRVAAAYAAERKKIGRVTVSRRTHNNQ